MKLSLFKISSQHKFTLNHDYEYQLKKYKKYNHKIVTQKIIKKKIYTNDKNNNFNKTEQYIKKYIKSSKPLKQIGTFNYKKKIDIT